jgi:MoaA/NifB/PqqE/SkfB family radical SAM enzyme
MREIIAAKQLPSPTEMGGAFIKYNLIEPLTVRPLLPKALLIYVTYRCNARCIMCGIWREHQFSEAQPELSMEELERIFGDRLFAEIEYININGGEPTLRRDLVDIVQLVVGKFPRLRHLSLNSNGLLCDRLMSSVERIVDICHKRGIYFSLVISFHGTGGLLDSILGIPGAFERVSRTLKEVASLGGDDHSFLSLNCVITNSNAASLYELLEWAKQQRMHINFVLGEVRERFFNLDLAAQTAVSGEAREEAIGFLRHLAQDRSFTNIVAFRYHHLVKMLEQGAKRKMACHYAMGGVILGSYGDLYYCKQSQSIGNCRERSAHAIYYGRDNLEYRKLGLIRDTCDHCLPNTFNRLEFQKDLLRLLRFLVGSGQAGKERKDALW